MVPLSPHFLGQPGLTELAKEGHSIATEYTLSWGGDLWEISK